MGLYGLQAQLAPQSRSTNIVGVCDINISSPARDRLNKVTLRNTDSLTVTVSGTATRCPSATVTVTKSENGAAETSVGTPSTNGSGVWTQGLTVTNAVSTKVFARMTINSRTTEASIIFDASTAKPKLAIAAPAANGAGVLNIVAASKEIGCGAQGNAHVYKGEPGWVGDADCAANGQVVTSFTVTGASGGTVGITYLGSSVFSSAVSSSPQTFTPTIVLTDITRGDLVFSATNGSGTTSTTLLTRVMTLVPPPVLSPDGGQAPETTLLDARNADVKLRYVLPAIPTNVESASIHIMWTTALVAYGLSTIVAAGPYPLRQPNTRYFGNPALVGTDGGRNYSWTFGQIGTTGPTEPAWDAGDCIIGDGTARWSYLGPADGGHKSSGLTGINGGNQWVANHQVILNNSMSGAEVDSIGLDGSVSRTYAQLEAQGGAYLGTRCGITDSSNGPTDAGFNVTDGTVTWVRLEAIAVNSSRFDGGVFDPMNLIDGGPDQGIDIFALGRSGGGCAIPSTDPNYRTGSSFNNYNGCPPDKDNKAYYNGLVYHRPDDCVLYDPSLIPQTWVCDNGVEVQAGAIRTYVVTGMPPLNTYMFWVVGNY